MEWMWPCYLYGQGRYNTSDMYVEVCVACKDQIAGIDRYQFIVANLTLS